MPILIKSSNGERKVQIMSRNTEKKETNQEQDLRSTLVSLLRGMTITLELKVNDVLVASSNSPINIDESTPKNVHVNQDTNLEALIQSGSVEMQDPMQQVPVNTAGVKQPELVQNTQPPQVKAKTSLSFAPLQALKVKTETQVPDIRPDPPAAKVEMQAARYDQEPQPDSVGQTKPMEQPRLVEHPRTVELPKGPVVGEPVQQSKLSPKPVNKQPEVEKANKPFLIRGDMKLCSAVTTVGLSVAKKDPIELYVTYDQKKLVESVIKIQEIADAIEAQSLIKTVDVGDIIFGKSNDDDSWYRGVVISIDGKQVEIYFFDWGISETLDITRIRRLTELGLGLAKFPACAVKVRFSDESKPYLNEVLGCEKRFSMRVESYDQDQEIYTATITKILPDE